MEVIKIILEVPFSIIFLFPFALHRLRWAMMTSEGVFTLGMVLLTPAGLYLAYDANISYFGSVLLFLLFAPLIGKMEFGWERLLYLVCGALIFGGLYLTFEDKVRWKLDLGPPPSHRQWTKWESAFRQVEINQWNKAHQKKAGGEEDR